MEEQTKFVDPICSKTKRKCGIFIAHHVSWENFSYFPISIYLFPAPLQICVTIKLHCKYGNGINLICFNYVHWNWILQFVKRKRYFESTKEFNWKWPRVTKMMLNRNSILNFLSIKTTGKINKSKMKHSRHLRTFSFDYFTKCILIDTGKIN